MRKVERIKPFLDKLGEIWERECPDWRFGQLMFNFISEYGDPFYMEEDQFIEALEKFFTPKQNNKEDTKC